jgi:SAM-dependent methyltransferase
MRLKLSGIHRNIEIAIKHVRVHGLRYCAASFWREIWFDLARGVDTMLPEHPDASPHSVHYQGADPKVVKQLLSVLPNRAKASTFIDFGCGKGRVLLLALEHGFQKVLGVEISTELSVLCRQNLARTKPRYDGSNVALLEADAATVELPPGPVTAFLFNPFHGPPLETVAQNLRAHAERNSCEVWLIYLNPIHLQVFVRHGFKVFHALKHEDIPLAYLAHQAGPPCGEP